MRERRSGRWDAGLLVALVSAAVGALAGNTTLVVGAAVALTFTVYGYATAPPSRSVTVERAVAATSPDPGDPVDVTVTVRNDGDETVSEVRVLDDPPSDLRVVDGAPSVATSLAPGETESVEYTVGARRGSHEFGDPVVVTRSVDGRTEREWAVETDDALTVTATLDSFPPAGQTVGYTGRVPTDDGGPGLEFHSVREYHPEDPMNRVDWNRYARTGRLRTIDFREHRAASVVVLVDQRDVATRVRTPGETDAARLAEIGGMEVVDALLDWNNLVGVGTIGRDLVYLDPDVGPEQRRRAEMLLGDRSGDARDLAAAKRVRTVGNAVWEYVERLNDRLSPDTQVVFVSPLLDDDAVSVARTLRAHGHATTVVSPDVTTAATPGGTVERIERATRIEGLRESGTRVIEWSIDEPLYVAVERATGRWST